MCLADNRYPINVGYIFKYEAIFFSNIYIFWCSIYFFILE